MDATHNPIDTQRSTTSPAFPGGRACGVSVPDWLVISGSKGSRRTPETFTSAGFSTGGLAASSPLLLRSFGRCWRLRGAGAAQLSPALGLQSRAEAFAGALACGAGAVLSLAPWLAEPARGFRWPLACGAGAGAFAGALACEPARCFRRHLGLRCWRVLSPAPWLASRRGCFRCIRSGSGLRYRRRLVQLVADVRWLHIRVILRRRARHDDRWQHQQQESSR